MSFGLLEKGNQFQSLFKRKKYKKNTTKQNKKQKSSIPPIKPTANRASSLPVKLTRNERPQQPVSNRAVSVAGGRAPRKSKQKDQALGGYSEPKQRIGGKEMRDS